jgi:hypothetical protein
MWGSGHDPLRKSARLRPSNEYEGGDVSEYEVVEAETDSIHVGSRPSPTKMAIFRRHEAVDLTVSGMMTEPVFPEAALSFIGNFDFEQLLAGNTTEVLLRHAGEDGFSLVFARFSPGYLLPRHSHSADCTYYIISGSLRLGSQLLTAGDGFFVPANRPYTYEAGEKGVDLLEFRHVTSFDMKMSDDKEEPWARAFAVASSHQAEWRKDQEAAASERLRVGSGERDSAR